MDQNTAQIPTLGDLIADSAATDSFRQAVAEFERGGRSDRIVANAGAPAVKVLRAISQLLAAEPRLPIDSVIVEGRSGCSDFRGTLTARANGEDIRYDFVWDCAWRAEQAGFTTFWGGADQQRAAREFGWDCFQQFERV